MKIHKEVCYVCARIVFACTMSVEVVFPLYASRKPLITFFARFVKLISRTELLAIRECMCHRECILLATPRLFVSIERWRSAGKNRHLILKHISQRALVLTFSS